MTPSEPQQAAQEPAEQVEPRRETKSLEEAILWAQGELPRLTKSETAKVQSKKGAGASYTYKYTDLAAVHAAALPVINRNGLIWLTFPGTDENGRPALDYELTHAATKESKTGQMWLAVGKDIDSQTQGSAITYGRRQALLAVLGLAPEDEDDDGTSAREGQREARERQQEARAGATVLTDARRQAMLDAIREAGLDVAETLEKAGIDPDGDVTAAQSRQVRALIDAAKPVEGAS